MVWVRASVKTITARFKKSLRLCAFTLKMTTVEPKMSLLTELENFFWLGATNISRLWRYRRPAQCPLPANPPVRIFYREPHEIPEPDKFPFRVLGVFRG
jgi:hypothetical protein